MSASLFVGQKLENGSGYGRTLLADEKKHLCELLHAQNSKPGIEKHWLDTRAFVETPMRRRHMKALATSLLIATTLATPVFAQSTPPWSDTVIVDGKYIGQDPDANVRLMLRRDAGSENNY
jgi:hypothetical protein